MIAHMGMLISNPLSMPLAHLNSSSSFTFYFGQWFKQLFGESEGKNGKGIFPASEKACAISGYLLGVNPFDQPGVEAYKRNMFALLGK